MEELPANSPPLVSPAAGRSRPALSLGGSPAVSPPPLGASYGLSIAHLPCPLRVACRERAWQRRSTCQPRSSIRRRVNSRATLEGCHLFPPRSVGAPRRFNSSVISFSLTRPAASISRIVDCKAWARASAAPPCRQPKGASPMLRHGRASAGATLPVTRAPRSTPDAPCQCLRQASPR